MWVQEGYPTEESGCATEPGYPTEEVGGKKFSGVIDRGYPTEESFCLIKQSGLRSVSAAWNKFTAVHTSPGTRRAGASSFAPPASVSAYPSCRYICLVEGMEFFPMELREAGIMAKLSRFLPVMEIAVGGQVRRTKAVNTNEWRDHALWKDESFVFEVNGTTVDLTATCIDSSGLGMKVIGAASLSLVIPTFDGLTTLQQLNLVRKSHSTGALALAGILHVYVTFFSATGQFKGQIRPRLAMRTKTSISTPGEDTVPFRHSLPAAQRSGIPAGQTTSNGKLSPPSRPTAAFAIDKPKAKWRTMTNKLEHPAFTGLWIRCVEAGLNGFIYLSRKLRPPVAWRTTSGWSSLVCCAVLTGVAAFFWLTSSVMPVPITPPDVTLFDKNRHDSWNGGPRWALSLCEVDAIADMALSDPSRHALLFKFIVDVLAFGS